MYRICFTISNISKTGGEERMCSMLANELFCKGYHVIVVSQNYYYWQKPFFEIDSNIRTYSLKRTLLEWGICHCFKRARYDIWKYHRILKKNNIQLIIDVDTELSLDSVLAKDGLDIKHISWEHFCYQRFINREVSSRIVDCINNKVDKLVVLTKADRDYFINDSHIPSEKVVQIYNPSPIENTQYIPHHSNTVLAMGRLEPEKGFDLLLQAWGYVENEADDWHLEIVGEGSCKDALLNQCRSLGLNNVIFSPYSNDPVDKYRNASIFVLPSRHEGLSLSLLEAANMSLPIVAFDCPNGPREIVIEGENGYLIKKNDIPGFAHALLNLMNDSEIREEISSNALGTVTKFKIETIIKEWETMFDDLMA